LPKMGRIEASQCRKTALPSKMGCDCATGKMNAEQAGDGVL
jgi:hypothetical protein